MRRHLRVLPGQDRPREPRRHGHRQRVYQPQPGHRIRITVKLAADTDLEYRATGAIRVKRTYRLNPRVGEIDAGDSETLRLRPRQMAAKRVAAALKLGKRVEAEVSVKLTDADGSSETEKLRVRLKR